MTLGFGLAAFAAGFRIHSIPLVDPDEGRNAAVALTTLRGGDWVLPHFHGFAYLDKPALLFDCVALSFRLLGVSEFAARLPSVLFAVATVGLTWILARRLFGSHAGGPSALVLATSPLFLGFSRYVIFDGPLTAFVVLALFGAIETWRGARWGAGAMWFAIGLGVMTKGPIALFLSVVFICALGFRHPRRPLSKCFASSGILVFLVTIVPWLMLLESRNPGYLRYVLVVESWERMTQGSFRRSAPIWYYLPVLGLGFLPWSGALTRRAIECCRRIRARTLDAAGLDVVRLLCASAIAILFFSASRSKLPGYILPVFPLLAMVVGAPGDAIAGRRPVVQGAVAAVFLAAALLRLPVGEWFGQPSALHASFDRLLRTLGIVLALTATAAHWLRGRYPSLSLSAQSTVGPVLLLSLVALAGPYAEANSARRLARELQRLDVTPPRVACVDCFAPGLDFYLAAAVSVVTDTGRELTSTYIQREYTRLATSAAGVWSHAELTRRLENRTVSALVTKGTETPAATASAAGQFGRFRLWLLEGAR